MTDFAATKAQFHLPAGMIYLDGNSLGPLPRATAARVAKTVEAEWGDMLITGWNKAGWMDKPMRVGDRIARLIGAEAGHVVMGDTLSIKVYQALASALQLAPSRRVILSDTGNFPSDLYMAQGLAQTLGADYRLKTVAPEAVLGAIDETVAVVMITEVDYRSGRRHDMAAMVARKPANQPVFDHPACAIGALKAVATCPAQSERRKAAPVKEQQALFAALHALFQRLE